MHGDLIAADLLLCWELTVELGALRDDAGSGRGALDETVGRFEAALDRAVAMLEGADDATRALYVHAVREAEDDRAAHVALRHAGQKIQLRLDGRS